MAPPVVSDEAEKTLLDIVPLARARRKGAGRKLEFQNVGEILKTDAL